MMLITKSMGVRLDDTTIDTGNPVFLDVTKPPFRLYGLCEPFYRVPEEIAAATSDSVADLARTCPGGRIRFSTDSDYIVVHAELYNADDWTVSPTVTNVGCDLFEHINGTFRLIGCFCPSQGSGKTYTESRIRLCGKPGMRDFLIHLPLFAKIRSFSIALREGCHVEVGSDYLYQTPVVFYGSSIVHGVGASKPGSNYPSVISRRLNTDFRNLGFSGAAKAEPAILDYIASLKMSAFVYDYDHNAPNPDYLRETHYAGYLRFRAVQPDTPVIMASKPDYYNPNVEIADAEARRQIIMESYRRGVESGDRNLWFIDGSTFYEPEYREESTADGCHPNDIGYLAMAKAFGAILTPLMKK